LEEFVKEAQIQLTTCFAVSFILLYASSILTVTVGTRIPLVQSPIAAGNSRTLPPIGTRTLP